ncbi:MAG: copper-translocating P-type ATPase [Chloroflexi bacterium RBG_13_68_17]|nr:MAG: copper-translocating P-type ATPase [Chloroflexi bacterium RBG_13_68_17]
MRAPAENLRLGIAGMDCAECVMHVESAVQQLPGIHEAHALLAAERLEVRYDPSLVTPAQIAKAVQRSGYAVKAGTQESRRDPARLLGWAGWLFAGLVTLVVAVEVLGERLGLLEATLSRVPPWLPLLAVLLGGFPIFVNVLRALLRRQVTAHALMTLGVIGALVAGETIAAVVIVFFMRVADHLEGVTTERSRQAIRLLMDLAPPVAHVFTESGEEDRPAADLRPGQQVVIRPGERCPADGMVEAGQAAVDQSPITGESMPVDRGPGQEVFAGTIVHGGALRVRVTRVGADSTLGRIVRLVEEAEANKAPVQRLADRFTAWYIPVVASAAVLTYAIGRDPRAAIAVLLVACACVVALATPTAVIAAVGRAARAGILIKGGRYLELLARVDTLVMDKTGTLTLGRPSVTDVCAFDGRPPSDVLALAAAAERHSEHPIAAAVRRAAGPAPAADEGNPSAFEALPGLGVRATWQGQDLLVGSRRLLAERGLPQPDPGGQISAWEAAGKTVFFVASNGRTVGALAVADTLREEVRQALDELRSLGIQRMLLLTGDNERTARGLAETLGIEFKADLLPADKIAAVRELQEQGRTVLMLGDGVNDAPALAQADVGVAMGVAGTDAALEAADVALMRDDWRAVPEAVRLGRRTFRVIQQNLALGLVYNLLGIGLAAFGVLPPVAAAAGQSIPDLFVMANSARLLRGP